MTKNSPIQLAPDEKLVLSLRQHWSCFLFPLIISFMVPSLSFLIVLLLDHLFLPFWLVEGLTQILLFVAFACFILGFLTFFWRLFLWFRTRYMITDKRLTLTKRQGLLFYEQQGAFLNQVKEVEVVTCGLPAAVLGYGDVVVCTTKGKGELVLKRVGNPYLVQRIILREAKNRQR